MKLIDKDVLVAEIERLSTYLDSLHEQRIIEKILSIINALEVKEVDLEKEYKDFVEEDPVYNKLVNGIVGKAIAKHFFELGIKVTQKEEQTMTANAPEKIYIDHHPFRDEYEEHWYSTPTGDKSVEYIRTDAFIDEVTDAFIEKAVSYLQQNWIWNTKIIEDFKSHMKGE